MAPNIMVCYIEENEAALVNIAVLKEPTKDISNMTRCTGMGNTHGWMVEFTMDNIITVKRKALVYSNGQMEGAMKANGAMGKCMGKERSSNNTIKGKRDSGRMENSSHGFNLFKYKFLVANFILKLVWL